MNFISIVFSPVLWKVGFLKIFLQPVILGTDQFNTVIYVVVNLGGDRHEVHGAQVEAIEKA